MRTFLQICLLLFLSLATIAQNNTQQKIDSMRKVIATQQGMEKVDSYLLLGSFLFNKVSLEEIIAYFEEYETVILQEQKKEKNRELIKDYVVSYALMKLNYCSSVLFKIRDYEELEKQARSAMDYCIKNDEWNYYYKLYNCLLKSFLLSQKYELAIQEASKLYEEARKNNHHEGMLFASKSLADIYMHQHRFDEAEKYYRESINLANGIDFRDVCYILAQAYNSLVKMLNVQERFDDILDVLTKNEQVVQKIEEIETQIGNVNQNYRLRLYHDYTAYYINMKNYEKADVYSKLMEEILRPYREEETPLYADYFLLRAHILKAFKQYAAAMEVLEKAIEISSGAGGIKNPMELIEFLKLKAELLIQLDRKEESIALYDSILTSTYRIRDVEFNAQLDELRTIYEVDKITAEKERNRNYFLFTLGGCFLLTLALGIWIYHSRTIVRKNRGLYSQIKVQDRLENELEAERRKNLELHLLLKPEEVVLEENEENLDLFFGKLTLLMKEQRLFTHSEVKRKDVASQIGISDRGLHDCIKNSTGMSFTEYINTLRLAYSRELLTNMDEKFTIDAVAYESGFNSRTTFYRLFNGKYGLSPKQFREISK